MKKPAKTEKIPPIPPMHYADWLGRHAQTRPQALAIVTPEARLNYLSLHRALHAAAHRLAECGIEPGQTVGLCIRSQALYSVMYAALNRMGCVSVSLARPTREGIAVPLVKGVTLDRIVIERPFAGIAPEGAIDIHNDWLKASGEDGPEWKGAGFRDAGSLAHICTSSGTTGEPKAIGFSIQQIERRFLRQSIGLLSAARADRILNCFGVDTFAGWMGSVLCPLWAGGTIYLGWPLATIPELVAREKIQQMGAAPGHFDAILRTGDPAAFDLSSLTLVGTGGSSIAPQLVATIRKKFCGVLLNGYGSTELGVVSFCLIQESTPLGQCGVLLPWIQGEAVDENDQRLPDGEEGFLRFRSDDMVSGYLGDAETSKRYFRDGWFYPGDIGKVTARRSVTVSGRTEDVINAGGVKIAPEAIENVVRTYAGITDCAAFAVPGATGIPAIWCAVVTDREIDLLALGRHCGAQLRVAPKHYLKLQELPRTRTGKVLRRDLLELARGVAREKDNVRENASQI